MIARRTLLKGVVALPALFLGKEVVKPEACKADEVCRPEAGSDFPFRGQFWKRRWWRAQGNKVEWTDVGYHPVYWRTDKGFVHWNIVPCNFDYCQALLPDRDVLLWVGRREVWKIYYDYSMYFQEFMFTFRYKCDRQYLNVMIHDLGFME